MSETHADRKVWYLRHLDLFASMSDQEIEELAQLLNDYEIPAGIELLGSRDHDQVYVVKTGAVRLHTKDPDQPLTLAILAPGRMFGLSTTIGDGATGLAATTLVTSYVCITTWQRLMEVLLHRPKVLTQVVRSLAEQVFEAEHWLERFGMASPRRRLTHLLADLVEQFGVATDDGRQIPFRLTQLDLARMIGVSRETVSRIMADLTEAGLLSRQQGLLTIHDPEVLRADAQ